MLCGIIPFCHVSSHRWVFRRHVSLNYMIFDVPCVIISLNFLMPHVIIKFIFLMPHVNVSLDLLVLSVIIWLHQLMPCAIISILSYGRFLYQSHWMVFLTNFGCIDNILSNNYWIFFSSIILLIWEILVWTCHVFYNNLGPKALHIT
jgi:hypothetical protein